MTPVTPTRQKRRQTQPLDRAALMAMIVLSIAIAAMLLLGAQALPHVRSFSWQNQPVAAEDIAFSLTFTRPMEPKSVEENLKIEPELSGKISWAGRKMAYTLDVPAPYGEVFDVSLPTAQALNQDSGFEPFSSEFHTRDRAFAYIGAEGDEKGRLILFNLTQKKKKLLTSEDKLVLDFEPYPGRDRILFSALDKPDEAAGGIASAQLYTVSTGLGATFERQWWQFWKNPDQALPTPGEVVQILDNEGYQNLKFDLAPNGESIVVQRVNNENPSDFGPWLVQPDSVDSEPRKIKTEPGGDFRIAPDSASLLFQQGKGTAVIDLLPEANTADSDNLLDFLPEYGLTLDVASDGSSAALVNFNQDDPDKRFTQSLFLVSNTGEEKPLLQTDGAILSAQFSENNEILYCLVNRLILKEVDDSSEATTDEQIAEDGNTVGGEITEDSSDESASLAVKSLGVESYDFTPYLTAINVETGSATKLLEMPPQPEINVSLSPDGLAILFDEALVSDAQVNTSSESFEGPTHRLWLLPLFDTLESRINGEPTALPPTELEIAGRQPVWLP